MAELLHSDLRKRLRSSFGKTKDTVTLYLKDGRKYIVGMPEGDCPGVIMFNHSDNEMTEVLIFDDMVINKESIIFEKYDRDMMTIYFESIETWEAKI